MKLATTPWKRVLTKVFVSAGLATMMMGCPGGGGGMDAGSKEVTVLSWAQDNIKSNITRNVDAFTKKTGITVKIVEVEKYDDLFPTLEAKATAGSDEFDVFLVTNIWAADFVNMGYAESLDPYIARDMASGELAWSDIPEGIKKKNSYGGHTYTMIVDNDGQNLWYRKDILGSSMWQAQYLAAKGKALPNPPTTQEELIEVAEFFEGKDWNPDSPGTEHGFVSNVTKGDQTYWFAYSWTAPHTVMPTNLAPAQSIFLFKPDMTPLVNTPGFIQGLTNWKTMVDKTQRGTKTQDIRDQLRTGKALMGIDWGDVGPISRGSDSSIKDKIGLSVVPGTRRYYNYLTDQWTDTTAVHRAPVHQFNGWAYYMTSTSKRKDNAWEFIKFMSSPEVSAGDVANPAGGFQPWRTSHSTNMAPWLAQGWSEVEAKAYVNGILESTNHPNASIDLRIPGASRYGAALEASIARIFDMNVDITTAMNDCAAEFNKITNELGKEPQIKAYKDHLGIK